MKLRLKLSIVMVIIIVLYGHSQAQTFVELNGGGVIPNANSFAGSETMLGYSLGAEYGFKFGDNYSLAVYVGYSGQSISSAIASASGNLLDQNFSSIARHSFNIYSIGVSHVASYERNDFLTPFIKLSVGYNLMSSPSQGSNEVNTVLFSERDLSKNFNTAIGMGFFIPIGNSNTSLGIEGDYNVIFSSSNLNLFGFKVLYRTML